MSKMTEAELKETAFQAKVLTENPAFNKAFETVKQAYVDKLLDTDVGQKGEREYYHICAKALEDVKNTLTLYLQNGRIQEKELRKKAKRYR